MLCYILVVKTLEKYIIVTSAGPHDVISNVAGTVKCLS